MNRGFTEEGFIVVWRKFLKTSFYTDSYAVHLALHLIIKASHEEHKFVFNKKDFTIMRGQCVVGRKKLAEETGINPSTIYIKLKLLENIGFCNIKSNNKFSVVTICKYSDYQDKKPRNKQQTQQQSNNKVTTTQQQSNTYNNDNNDNNDNKVALDTFLTSLKTNAAYNHINIEIELGKMDAWLLAHPGRQKTKRFIVNWLNKIEKPLQITKPSNDIDKQIKADREKHEKMIREAVPMTEEQRQALKKMIGGIGGSNAKAK